MEYLNIVSQIMNFIGVPSILIILAFLIKLVKNVQFISSAIKSQIRNELIKDFEAYDERGWCSSVEQTEWLNRYKNYHNLYGENGVLDKKKDRMEVMPSSKQ